MVGCEVGESNEEAVVVDYEQTAAAFGNEGVEVVATPCLIGMLEVASARLIERHLEAGQSSVGTRVCVDHVGAAPVGATVVAKARITAIDSNRISFDVEAAWDGKVLMKGTHDWAVVDLERLLKSLPKPAG